MSEKQKTRVLWLTNLPAPYRFPIWDRMAKDVQLKVVFLLKRRNWRNWPEPTGKNWKHEYLSFNSWQISEYDIIPSFRGARKLLQDVDVAIIGGWESPMFIRSILLAKKKKIKVIQFYESTGNSHRFSRGLIAHIRKWILTKPDEIVTISTASTHALIDMGVPTERIHVLFNPVDVHWFHDYANLHREAETSGHKFLYVGQLIERKNVHAVIQAFAIARAQGDTLTIVGEGPLSQKLIRLTHSLNLQSRISFVGNKNQKELGELYARNNTLVLASKNEVWGLVINEALAAGNHVIVSKVSGVSDFVKEMRGVYICSVEQDSIAEKMNESRRDYCGRIEDPEILNFTPEYFALRVEQIINMRNI
jgi:glycosyltransferase involved in cell wall biosynthesis